MALEDLAMCRAEPNCTVLYPCDAVEAKKATLAAAKTDTPVYLRLAREKTPIVTTEETPFEIGKGQVLYRPQGIAAVAIIATGSLVANALRTAADLEKKGIKAIVANIHTIKPIDTELLIALAKETKAIVTVEEHQRIGGLGGAVAEVLASAYPTHIEFVGVHDEFGQSGTPNQLVEHYGMGRDGIASAVMKVLERK